MITFDDVIGVIHHKKDHRENGYSIPLAPKFNEKVGNITPGVVTVVGGLPEAGTTSFVDLNYVMNTLLQWYLLDNRPHLKIMYFSMADGEMKKFQQLLCCYIRLMHNFSVDIASLNFQSHGKVTNEDDVEKMLECVEESRGFFDEVLSTETLEIIDGLKSPSDIYNKVTKYMQEIGTDKVGSPYEYDSSLDNPLVLVIVDKVDFLKPEVDSFSSTVGNDLHMKMSSDMRQLSRRYNISPILIMSAQIGFSRNPKDTEPHYRQLGQYGKFCDKGIMLYSPIKEKNTTKFFSNNQEEKLCEYDGKNVVRWWFIVRNSDGVASSSERMVFLPSSGFMIECPSTEIITSYDELNRIAVSEPTPYQEDE